MNTDVTRRRHHARPDQAASAPNALGEGPTIANDSGHAARRDHPVERGDPPEELAGHQPLHQRDPHHDEDRDRPPRRRTPPTIACQHRRDEPEAGRHAHPERPARYITVSGLRGSPPRCADHERREHRPDAAGAEHQAEVDLRPVHRFLTTNGTSVSHGPQTAQQAHDRRRPARPAATRAPHVPEPSSYVGPERAPVLRVALGADARAHQHDHHGRERERERVDQERLPRARRCPPAARRSSGPISVMANGRTICAERVRLHEQVRRARCSARSTRTPARTSPDRRRRPRRARSAIGIVSWSVTMRQPIVPIATSRRMSPAIIRCRRSTRSESAPEPSSSTPAGATTRPRRRERGGVFDSRVDLPGDRDEVDPVADHRDGHPDPQQREVADRERLEDAEPAESRADAAHRPSIRSRDDDPARRLGRVRA